jgi:hypothetical protein
MFPVLRHKSQFLGGISRADGSVVREHPTREKKGLLPPSISEALPDSNGKLTIQSFNPAHYQST